MPSQSAGRLVQGRSRLQFKATLASFSMEGKVVVITGGCGGLGLVMGQGLVESGADLAIVDLNGTSYGVVVSEC